MVSKPVTERFLGDIGQIYSAYDVYYQGGGVEQIVFDSVTDGRMRRSELICRRLSESGRLQGPRRAIDLGCGNGGFLRALSKAFQGWELFGLELDGRSRDLMRSIPGFVDLIEGDVETLAGTFDFISMIHALEHFTDPGATLERLRRHLTPGGMIFIEIPNVQENPFDLLIADHVSHFAPHTLEAMLLKAGYAPVVFATDWVKKEMSVLAVAVDVPPAARFAPPPASLADDHIAWLAETLRRARDAAASAESFGIFGTSIASTWLSGGLGETVLFYVDEDPSRQGREFFGKPIIGPERIPDGSTLFVALAPAIASVVSDRIAKAAPGTRLVMTPGLASA
jgi:SAM-dependent methyltransferase